MPGLPTSSSTNSVAETSHRSEHQSPSPPSDPQKMESQFKIRVFGDKTTEKPEAKVLFFDNVRVLSKELDVLKIILPENGDSKPDFEIQLSRWNLLTTGEPLVQLTQTLNCPKSTLEIYGPSAENLISHKPHPFSGSEDGQILRFGSKLYRCQSNGQFQPMNVEHDLQVNIEELSSNGSYMAVASRHPLPDPQKTKPVKAVKVQSPGAEETDVKSQHSMSIESQPPNDHFESFDPFDSDSNASNSARDSWSEASTIPQPDEIDDEFGWRDSEDEYLDEKIEATYNPEGTMTDEALDKLADSIDEEEKSKKDEYAIDLKLSDLLNKNGGFFYDEASQLSDSSDDSGDSLFRSGAKGDRRGEPCELRVFKLGGASDAPLQRVFRFFTRSTESLVDSPPAFHPSEDLVVWPIGGRQLLFANFTQNSYFTRTIDNGRWKIEQFCVQCRFSVCGRYLHIACVANVEPKPKKDTKGLYLHVLTYRLSGRKAVRCAPRLVDRHFVNLGKSLPTIRGSVPDVPFTLTWTDAHVYATENSSTIQIYRVPLYQSTNGKEKKHPETMSLNASDAALPWPAGIKKLWFIPNSSESCSDKSNEAAQSETAEATKADSTEATEHNSDKTAKGPMELTAQLICGSYNNAIVSAAPEAKDHKPTPPRYVGLTSQHVSPWESTMKAGDGPGARSTRMTWKWGRLAGQFDNLGDCDCCH
ncbi:hypothetical protein F4778DRAFT_754176 [Xylariomycetidae sp. FL2044]|nr:hypothetical protein F4778DRAFT_754176 [Xylariomycetidae sp. FL2044]